VYVMAVGAPGRAFVTRVVFVVVGHVVVVTDGEHLHDVAREVAHVRELERCDEREELKQADQPAQGTSTTAHDNDCREEGRSLHEANVLGRGAGASSSG